MGFEGLTNDHVEKAEACETPEEVLALARKVGYQLTDEELDSISAGGWSPKKALPKCPMCGSYAVSAYPMPNTGCLNCVCQDCGYKWNETELKPFLPS